MPVKVDLESGGLFVIRISATTPGKPEDDDA
jgi:hypothetical protein